jgi:secreted trypsin-like serine protease
MRRSLSVAVGVAGLLVATAVIGLSLTTPAEAVADGTLVPEGHYRFSVKLTMTNIPTPEGGFRDSACSASLVAAQWIMTAGHCFHNVNGKHVSGPVPYATTALVGQADVSGTGGHLVNVVWVEQAPGTTDIAVAKLDQPITDVKPIELSTRTPKIGEVLRLTGWGASSSDNPKPGTHLQTGQVKVSSLTDNAVGVKGYKPLPTTSACLYDSGAPYFLERSHKPPLLVSLDSDGPDCPHDQEETTARVDTIAKWAHGIIWYSH